MNLLQIPLSNDQYSVQKSADEYVRVQLEGGAGRYGKDLFGISDLVTVSFILSPNEYNYLKAFYDYSIATGDPFLMNLMIDRFELLPYECRFMPSTFRLTGTKGLNVFVTATVEAILYGELIPSNEDLFALITEFGVEYEKPFVDFEDKLNIIVNVDLPKDLKKPYILM